MKTTKIKTIESKQVKHCEHHTCFNLFIIGRKKKFCSQRCADLKGRLDWKKRNSKQYKISENLRKKRKYKTDEEYREGKKKKQKAMWHSKTPEEKYDVKKTERIRREEVHGVGAHREYMREYHKIRSMNDIDFRLRGTLRARVREAIKNQGGNKSHQTKELVGCEVSFLREYLEAQFLEGMSWENYGVWEIDHKKPCAAFDLSDINQQKECFHYTNLQPLWAEENRSKSSSYKGKKYSVNINN